MVILIVIAFILGSLTIDAVIKFNRSKKHKVSVLSSSPNKTFSEESVSIANGVYYDKTHTWAFMEKNGLVKIGVDDFLLHITGSLSKLKMKKPGDKVLKGEVVLSINQNGKQLNIFSPISGTVKSLNNQLVEESSLINSSPFNDGWVYMIEPTNWLREVQLLFMADKYKEWLKSEFTRLKDFIATIGQINNQTELSPIILQDGGELKDNVLENFGPEVWEEFQTRFINTSR